MCRLIPRNRSNHAAAFRAQGQERHLPAHDRVTASFGHVRLQAAAAEAEGENCPDEYLKGRRFAFTSGVPKLMGTPHDFKQHGQTGAWMSDAVPELAKHVDDISFIKRRRISLTTRRRSCCSTPVTRAKVGRAWVRGSRTGSAARTRIYLASWRSSPAAYSPMAARTPSAAALCPACSKACNVGPRAIRCSMCPTPKA